MSAHTPGPWIADRIAASSAPESWGVFPEIPAPGLHFPAECHGPNAEANARLIAAAPELADALEAMLCLFHRCGSVSDIKPKDFTSDTATRKSLDALAKAGRLS